MKAVLTGLFVGAFVGWLAGYFGQLAFVLDRDTPVAGIAVSSLLALVSPLTFAAAAAGALVGICLVPIIVLMSRKRGVGGWCLIAALTLAASPALAEWQTWEIVDPMDGTVTWGIHSPPSKPLKEMGFPYKSAEGAAMIGCRGVSGFLFSARPHLRGGERNRIGMLEWPLRVKFDDNAPVRLSFMQDRHSQALFYVGGWTVEGPHILGHHPNLPDKIFAHETLLLELPWRGQGDVVWRFDLRGSRASYEEACP